MKFTSEDLMKAMGLKVGDRVKFKEGIFPIIRKDGYICYQEGKYFRFIAGLVDAEIEILPAPKRVGDLKCEKDIKNCSKCPLRAICEAIMFKSPMKLYDILERYKVVNNSDIDQEIYDILKARLDKEVKDNA